jgi:D-alanyl-D-alanine dipeptidase
MSKDLPMIHGLVPMLRACPTLGCELVYSTKENIFGTVLYTSNTPWLLPLTAQKLCNAQSEAISLGFRLLILDAYRPLGVQKLMWDFHPDANFVAPPQRGSNHNRGAAVDVRLTDLAGIMLDMPSDFDEFSERASHHWQSPNPQANVHRQTLKSLMEEAGFQSYHAEWWHYNDPDSLSEPLLDIPLEVLEREITDQ